MIGTGSGVYRDPERGSPEGEVDLEEGQLIYPGRVQAEAVGNTHLLWTLVGGQEECLMATPKRLGQLTALHDQ